MKINSNTRQDLLDALRPVILEESDLTISMAYKEWKVGRAAAATILEKGVKDGLFIKLWGILENDKPGWIYRPVNEGLKK